MKLPQFIEPIPFETPGSTEPGQALTLEEVVYRVSRGETTGIGQIPLEYGDDDGSDDPYINGLEAEKLDVAQIALDLSDTKKKIDNRLKFLKAKTTRLKSVSPDDKKDPSA